MPKRHNVKPRRRPNGNEHAGSVASSVTAGPRKQRRAGPCPPRHTRHKARAAWFRARVAWPMREAPVERLAFERRRVARTLPASKLAAKWTMAGPTNIGG